MKKRYTQKEIFDYLKANPYGFRVHVGDLDDLNNQDYIFFDYLNETVIAADNDADYVDYVEISIVSTDYDLVRLCAKYVKRFILMPFTYSKAEEHEYYLAQGRAGILIGTESISI